MTLPTDFKSICAEQGRRYAAGPGAARQAWPFLRDLGCRKPLLVLGRGFLESSGRLTGLLREWGLPSIERIPIGANPHVRDVASWLARRDEAGADGVMAIGGGSVLDAAKIIALVSSSSWSPQLRTLPQGLKPLPLVLGPTTAGTGSEVTPYASFESEEGLKFSFDDSRLLPGAVIHDPALLVGQPRFLAACSAADALSQAIESLWAVRGTAPSRERATAALRIMERHLASSVLVPTLEGKLEMLEAAGLAGAAIATGRTTAVHALSYPLTARFNIPHGQALAALLPMVMEMNAPHLQEDVTRQLQEIFKSASWQGVVGSVRDLLRKIGMPACLKDLNLPTSPVEVMLREGFRPDRMGNNPFVPTPEVMKSLLTTSLR